MPPFTGLEAAPLKAEPLDPAGPFAVVNALRALAPAPQQTSLLPAPNAESMQAGQVQLEQAAGDEVGAGAGAASSQHSDSDQEDSGDEEAAEAAAQAAAQAAAAAAAAEAAAAAAACCRVLLEFAPATAGPFSQLLTMHLPSERLRVLLIGQGAAPRVVLGPAGVEVVGLDMGDVLLGEPVQRKLTITNSCAFAVAFATRCGGTAAAARGGSSGAAAAAAAGRGGFSCCPAAGTLLAGECLELQVTFRLAAGEGQKGT